MVDRLIRTCSRGAWSFGSTTQQPERFPWKPWRWPATWPRPCHRGLLRSAPPSSSASAAALAAPASPSHLYETHESDQKIHFSRHRPWTVYGKVASAAGAKTISRLVLTQALALNMHIPNSVQVPEIFRENNFELSCSKKKKCCQKWKKKKHCKKCPAK